MATCGSFGASTELTSLFVAQGSAHLEKAQFTATRVDEPAEPGEGRVEVPVPHTGIALGLGCGVGKGRARVRPPAQRRVVWSCIIISCCVLAVGSCTGAPARPTTREVYVIYYNLYCGGVLADCRALLHGRVPSRLWNAG